MAYWLLVASLWTCARALAPAQTIVDGSNVPLPDPRCSSRALHCINRNYHPNKLLKPPVFGTQHGSCEAADAASPGAAGTSPAAGAGLPVAVSDAVVVGTYVPKRKHKRLAHPVALATASPRKPVRQTAYFFVVVDRCTTYANHSVRMTTQVLKIPLDANRKIVLSTRRDAIRAPR